MTAEIDFWAAASLSGCITVLEDDSTKLPTGTPDDVVSAVRNGENAMVTPCGLIAQHWIGQKAGNLTEREAARMKDCHRDAHTWDQIAVAKNYLPPGQSRAWTFGFVVEIPTGQILEAVPVMTQPAW